MNLGGGLGSFGGPQERAMRKLYLPASRINGVEQLRHWLALGDRVGRHECKLAVVPVSREELEGALIPAGDIVQSPNALSGPHVHQVSLLIIGAVVVSHEGGISDDVQLLRGGYDLRRLCPQCVSDLAGVDLVQGEWVGGLSEGELHGLVGLMVYEVYRARCDPSVPILDLDPGEVVEGHRQVFLEEERRRGSPACVPESLKTLDDLEVQCT